MIDYIALMRPNKFKTMITYMTAISRQSFIRHWDNDGIFLFFSSWSTYKYRVQGLGEEYPVQRWAGAEPRRLRPL